MGNYPDNVSASDPTAPWNQTREPAENEAMVQIAIAELDELFNSLLYLDKRIVNRSSPYTVDPGIYTALGTLRRELTEMIGPGQGLY
jgi:hypothetical protein